MTVSILTLSHLPDDRHALLERLDTLPFGERERAHLQAIGHTARLRESLGAHEALLALSGANALPILRDANGKPHFAGPDAPFFNLTHTDGLAAAALASSREGPVGIDLEVLRPMPRRETIARRFFSSAALVRMAASPHPDREFFSLWTAKEAAVKCTGQGLAAIDKPPKDTLSFYTYALRAEGREAILTLATAKPVTIQFVLTNDMEIQAI